MTPVERSPPAPSNPLHIVVLDYRDIHHPQAGGAERYIDEIFQRIATHGHRVTLLCARYAGAPVEERIGQVMVRRAGNTANVNVVSARAALKLARRERVDIFVENICKLPFLLPMLTRTPVLPVVHHLFGTTIFYQLNPLAASYAWLYERMIPRCYRGLRFVSVSESTTRDLRRRGLQHSRIDLVHNGVDFGRYQLNGGAPVRERPLLVYVGRLQRYKQIDIVLRAFARVRRTVPGAELALVGKGDDRQRLETVAHRLGIAEAVHFVGYVSEEEKIAWMHRAHAVVYPSPKEGWGVSTIEAAACGTPVLASDADGLRDAVRDGATGFLIPHLDEAAWAARMTEVLTDPALRTRLGTAGREWARGFGWDAEAEKMRAIVEAVAAGDTRTEAR